MGRNKFSKNSNTKAKRENNSSDGVIEGIEVTPKRGVTMRHKPSTLRSIDDAVTNAVTNDPSFYNHSPHMAELAGSVSFFSTAGYPVRVSPDASLGVTLGNATTIPGIMTFSMVTGPGLAKDKNDAVNMAANNIYAYVRHDNSGAKNYDPADLMLMILAMDEVYQWFEYGKRAYGLVTTYSNTNRYVPRALTYASGFDFSAIESNLANFNMMLNLAVGKINSINVPKQFSLLERHARLYRGVYMDENTGKSQLYLMKPHLIRKYVETEGAGSLQLAWSESSSAYLTPESWNTVMNQLLDAVRFSTDIGDIGGDLLKSYGTGNMIRLSEVPSNYSVLPAYDFTLLMQFRNATPIGVNMQQDLNNSAFNITQNAGIGEGEIVYNPTLTVTYTDTNAEQKLTEATAMCFGNVLDLPLEKPSAMDVIEATRLMTTLYINTPDDPVENTVYYNFRSMSSEVVFDVSTYTLPSNSDVPLPQPYRCLISARNSAETVQSAVTARVFDYRPTQYWLGIGYNSTSKSLNMKAPCGDLNNYAIMDPNTLLNINLMAILSEFSVPIH